MNTISKLCLSALLMVSISVQAKQTVNETLDADPQGVVRVEHVSGKAKIIGWENSQVKVEGELGENTKEFIFERNGNSVDIIVEVEQESWWGNSGSKGDNNDNLTIYVPMGSRVKYESVNADVNIEQILGGVDAEVVNGDITAKNLQSAVKLESVNGDITAQDLTGTLTIESVNGDISATGAIGETIYASAVNGDISVVSSAKEVRGETVNGDIELNMKEVSYVTTETVNGSIEMTMRLAPSAVVKASSVGGSIELALPSDASARFEVETFAGGRIRNRFTDHKAKKDEYGPGSRLNISTPNPTATVEIDTVSGTITLSKQ
jgi:DUF4097 and DUF4098 domain-containing protein YvlB